MIPSACTRVNQVDRKVNESQRQAFHRVEQAPNALDIHPSSHPFIQFAGLQSATSPAIHHSLISTIEQQFASRRNVFEVEPNDTRSSQRPIPRRALAGDLIAILLAKPMKRIEPGNTGNASDQQWQSSTRCRNWGWHVESSSADVAEPEQDALRIGLRALGRTNRCCVQRVTAATEGGYSGASCQGGGACS